MAIADHAGLPIAAHVDSASPRGVKLVDQTIENCFLAKLPKRIIGDMVYDNDPLDKRAISVGADIIAP